MNKIEANDAEAQSADIVADNLSQLQSLFPEAFAEGKVQFDTLRQLLGGTVDEADEKYGLNWHGKRRARQIALTPSTGTLRPCPDESVDWDTTQNLMIEGDNLEVLKLLQKSYAGKVKMIYIDPPYNTGKDFIYPDNFRDSIGNYLALTGQSEGGVKIASNLETSGRFHTDWLNMIYPRLRLARNLLLEDGALFISIDDHEVDSLRKVCAEIFGEENFIAQFIWNTEGHTDNQFDVKVNHEYVVVYAKNASSMSMGHVIDPNTRDESNLWKGFAENSITKNGPANPPSEVTLPIGFPCTTASLDLPANKPPKGFYSELQSHGFIMREMTDGFNVSYPIRLDQMCVIEGRLSKPCRVFSGWANANKLKAFIDNKCHPIDDNGDKVSFNLSDRGVVYYRRERDKARNIVSVLRNFSTTEKMRSELETIGIPFQYPKPKELLQYLVQVGCEGDGIVMDYFAGSGSTAHAVWLQSVADSVSRRFILVQLPEPLDSENEKHRPAIQFCSKANKPKVISELTKERLRKVSEKIKNDNGSLVGDFGFRVFKLDKSNIREWNPDPESLAQSLLDHHEHILEGRTEADIVYELLLKLGLDLCVPMKSRTVSEKTIGAVGGGVLMLCMAEKISAKEVEAVATGIVSWHKELAPAGDSTVVFRDSAFADDVAKTNMAAILAQNGLENVRSL